MIFHDENDANSILPEDAPSTGVHITHISRAEDLQILGLIPDNTDNTRVPENARVGEQN